MSGGSCANECVGDECDARFSTSLAGYCAYQYANSDALTDNIRRPFQPILDKPQKSVSGIRVFQSSRKLWSPISSDASYVTVRVPEQPSCLSFHAPGITIST